MRRKTFYNVKAFVFWLSPVYPCFMAAIKGRRAARRERLGRPSVKIYSSLKRFGIHSPGEGAWKARRSFCGPYFEQASFLRTD